MFSTMVLRNNKENYNKMKNWKRILGIAILAILFFGLIAMVASAVGWGQSILIWGGSALFAGLIYGAVYLIFSK